MAAAAAVDGDNGALLGAEIELLKRGGAEEEVVTATAAGDVREGTAAAGGRGEGGYVGDNTPSCAIAVGTVAVVAAEADDDVDDGNDDDDDGWLLPPPSSMKTSQTRSCAEKGIE